MMVMIAAILEVDTKKWVKTIDESVDEWVVVLPKRGLVPQQPQEHSSSQGRLPPYSVVFADSARQFLDLFVTSEEREVA